MNDKTWLYISYGIPKSASTFAWELIKRIAIVGGIPVASLTSKSKGQRALDYVGQLSDENLELIRADTGDLPVVIKTHAALTPAIARLLADGRAKVFISYRDLRDTALSLLDHSERSRETGIKDFAQLRELKDTVPFLRDQVKRLESWAGTPNPVFLEYDELCFRTPQTIARIAETIGVAVDADALAREFAGSASSIRQFNKGERRRFEREMDQATSELFKKTFPDYYANYFPGELNPDSANDVENDIGEGGLCSVMRSTGIPATRHGEASPVALVDEVISATYRALLERQPDPGGLQAYRNAFKGVPLPVGLEHVLGALSRSKEFQHKTLSRIKKAANAVTDPEPQILFIQTADSLRYRPLLDLSSKAVHAYCLKHNYNYQTHIGIIRGYHAWHATFNRIPMLHRLAESDFRGWACYLDADAFIADLNFDLAGYLADKSDVALIAAGGGQSFWWAVNAGVLFVNFGHPLGRALAREWNDAFSVITEDELRLAVNWHTVPNDQNLLHQVLRGMPYIEKHMVVDRTHPPLLNYDGRFIKQILRVSGNLDERAGRLREEVNRVLGA